MRNFAGMVYRTISRGGVSNRKGGGVEGECCNLLVDHFCGGFIFSLASFERGV